MKTILITGSTGFVGKHLLNLLIFKNIKIKVIVRKEKKNEIQLIDKNIEIILSEDIYKEEESWWINICKDVDILLNAAWYAEPGKYLQSFKNIDCLNGSLRIALACQKSGVKKYVGIGTCFEYEMSDEFLSINTNLKPTTLYAATKVATYLTLKEFFHISKIDFLWCRLFYLYGKGEDIRRLVPYIHNRIQEGKIVELTSGDQIRDYLDVEFAAKMIIEVTLSNTVGPINICSGVPITIKELSENIANSYGRIDLLKFGAKEKNLTDPNCVVGIK